MVAYWLIPAETARSLFVSIISELAARFDAPSWRVAAIQRLTE